MANNNDGWEKIEPTTGEIWNFDKDAELCGTFIECRNGVGPNNSNLYFFEVEDGKGGVGNWGVWGSTVLDTRLKNLTPGEETKIIYRGIEKGEKTGREYKNFEVYHRPAPKDPDSPFDNK